MARRFISIKNYENYQHYKHRNPPWVKIHLSLLDEPDFLDLPDASKWHYIGLILLASRHGNDIKPDEKYIRNRLGLTENLDLTKRFLKEHVLASSASVVLCSTSINADSEKSRVETEKSRGEVNAVQVSAKPSPPPISDDDWLLSLKDNKAYLGIDINNELAKCKTWCETNRKTFSRRRFVNWLNRAERPIITVNGIQPTIKHAPIPPFPGPEDPIGRANWRKAYGQLQPIRG